LFPFFIFLFTIIAYLKLDSSYILKLLENNLPSNIYEAIASTIVDIVDVQRSGLLSLSIFLTIYTASGGFRAFMTGINKAMGIKNHHHIFYKYVMSIFWVIFLTVSILLSLVGIVFGKQIIALIYHYIPSLPMTGIINVLRTVIPLVLILVLLTGIYMFIPARGVKFKHAFPGAIFATVTWILATLLVQLYVNNYGDFTKYYGALGTAIALLLWLLWTSIIMIVGASFNAFLIEIKEVEHPYFSLKRKKKSIENIQEAKVDIPSPDSGAGNQDSSAENKDRPGDV
jgi:membrane protein